MSDLDRKPGELLRQLKAIREHCKGCCGGSSKEVALCTVTACHLWPLRYGSRKRGLQIVGEEKRLGHVEERHWAERLESYTGQTYYRTEKAALARETRNTEGVRRTGRRRDLEAAETP